MKYFLVVLMLAGLAGNPAKGENGRAPEPKSEAASPSDAKAAAPDGSKPKTAGDSKKEKSRETIRQTPFGPVKVITPKEPVPRPVDPSIQVEEEGDQITFRRKTPFGVHVWTKKRADLTLKEKELLDGIQASRSKPDPDPPAAVGKEPAKRNPRGTEKNR